MAARDSHRARARRDVGDETQSHDDDPHNHQRSPRELGPERDEHDREHDAPQGAARPGGGTPPRRGRCDGTGRGHRSHRLMEPDA